MENYDRQIFHRPVNNLLKEPVYYLEQWIATNERAVVKGIKRAKARSKHETQSITEFYNVIPATNETRLAKEVREYIKTHTPPQPQPEHQRRRR
jgi:sulfur relay (sulfurtransferase) DsrC/TusE family protein